MNLKYLIGRILPVLVALSCLSGCASSQGKTPAKAETVTAPVSAASNEKTDAALPSTTEQTPEREMPADAVAGDDTSEPVMDQPGAQISTCVSGSFSATVRKLLPDYCLDDVTPLMALVTEFQDYPFTMYVGEEIGSQLQEGEVYVFTIEPVVTELPRDLLENMDTAALVWVLPSFRIAEFRPAEENEWGMMSPMLEFSDMEE